MKKIIPLALILSSIANSSYARLPDSDEIGFQITQAPLEQRVNNTEICGLPINEYTRLVRDGLTRTSASGNTVYIFNGGHFTELPEYSLFIFQSPQIRKQFAINYENGEVGNVVGGSSLTGPRIEYSPNIENEFCNIRI